ncbi:MAG: methionine--tRNA ligase [bacterium]|nr:MAG: methionine--tRNA ligase [bacterium]
MKKAGKFYVTTPIYYVNDVPHLGHVYTTVAADVLARYHRLEGREVFFLTGTDEHGQKADQAAARLSVPVEEHVEAHSAVFKNLWKDMGISNDDFIRTTDKRHKKVVRQALQTLYDKGEIYSDVYEGWYCVPDERFWTEKDLKGCGSGSSFGDGYGFGEANGAGFGDGSGLGYKEICCPDCGRPVQRIKEKNYFFKMGKYRDWLIDHIKNHDGFILPVSRRNEVLGFLEKKLEDLCISRPKTRMSWGIELPFDSGYVTYVWFDALLNYVSAPGLYAQDSRFDKWWPADLHLIGKDILTTHSVYWITMLKALELPIPKRIFAHGWWTIDGKKMSKSLGNVVNPSKIAEAVGLDQFRYFLMREVPFGLDGNFSINSLINRINVDLANNLGNLISRTLTMIKKYRGSVVPRKITGGTNVENIKTAAMNACERYSSHMGNAALSKALDEMIMLCDELNRFIVKSRPWTLAGKKGEEEKLDDILYGSAETLRVIGRMMVPFMPNSAQSLFKQLGLRAGYDGGTLEWGCVEGGHEIAPEGALFPRIDEKKADEVKDSITRPRGREPEKKSLEQKISIDDFKKVKIVTATIISAQPVPKSKKLLKLQVDIGYEKRQVVAGIAERCSPEELMGRRVLVVTNLKPVKIMGVESNGMLLAASDKGKLILAGTSEDAEPGLRIT